MAIFVVFSGWPQVRRRNTDWMKAGSADAVRSVRAKLGPLDHAGRLVQGSEDGQDNKILQKKRETEQIFLTNERRVWAVIGS